MAITLKKGGQSYDISISKLRIGLGWEPNEDASDYPFDLDVSAFMIGSKRKISREDYLVYYNSKLRVDPSNLLSLVFENPDKYPPYVEDDNKPVTSHECWRRKTRPVDPEFSLFGSIDDMEGVVSAGGDDETMNIDLRKVNPSIHEIVIAVSIYEFSDRTQNFGQVDDSYIVIYNQVTNEELYRYDLTEDFGDCSSVEFCSIYREGSIWKIRASGLGHKNGLQSLVDLYV